MSWPNWWIARYCWAVHKDIGIPWRRRIVLYLDNLLLIGYHYRQYVKRNKPKAK